MGYADLDDLTAVTATKRKKKVNPGVEAGKLGIFAVGVAVLCAVVTKLKGWAGVILLRGRE